MMAKGIRLDLGEYGEVYLEPTGRGAESSLEEAELGDWLRVKASKGLMRPLVGLARMAFNALEEMPEDERFEFDGFGMECEVSLEAEGGSELPVAFKIGAGGSFKYSYSWKRREEAGGAEDD